MATRFYEFGAFRIDKLNHVLMREGQALPLKPKVFDTLLVLVENRDRVIEKDELLSRLWPDTVVEESNLTQNVYLLRKALGEEPHGEVFIQTMPKRGYRFVAAVTEVDADSSDMSKIPPDSQPVLISKAYGISTMKPKVEGAMGQRASTTGPRIGTWKIVLASFGGTAIIILSIWLGRMAINNPSGAGPPSPQIKSLAVLPFKPLGSDLRDEDLGFGLSDTLITRLSSIRTLVVRPTSSTRRFSSPDQDPVAAGRDLRVDAVLDGTMQRAGDRIRINLRLIRVSDGVGLWNETVEEHVNDTFTVQDRVSEQVARMLAPQMTGEEQQLVTKHYTEDPEAYRLYVLGRYHKNRNNIEEWNKAIDYFHAAIRKDPKYALPYAGLADCYLSLVADQTLPKHEAVVRAREAAVIALKLDYGQPEPHISLARIKAYYDWDWSGAENEFRRALDLGPNSPQVRGEYSSYLATVGRNEEAVSEAMHARELDPLSPATHFGVAWALLGARRYDEVISEAEKVLTTFPVAQYWIGMAHLGKGHYEPAIAAFEKRLKTTPGDSLVKASLGFAFGKARKQGDALRIIRELELLYDRKQVSPYNVAMAHAGLNDKSATFRWLERAFNQRSRSLWGLKVNPMWDSVRSEPEFGSLLERMGLPK